MIALCGLIVGLAVSAAPPVEQATFAYVPGGSDLQSLDLFWPKGGTAVPVLLFFHGGVWRHGDKAQYANVGAAFASQGIMTAVANYRLVPQASHADQVSDAAAAAAWLSKNAAKHGGDPARLYLAGHSAGGELISTLLFDPQPLTRVGVSAEKLAGVLPLSGIFDLTQPIDDGPGGGFEDYVYPVFGSDRSVLRALSPVNKVHPTSVPILVLVAGDDSQTMREQSAQFVKALKVKTIAVDSVSFPRRGHFELVTELGSPGDPATARIARFILVPAR